MATGRVLKKLLAMSALAGALLIAAPSQARDRDHGHGDRHGHYDRHGGHGGDGWNGHHRYRHHGGYHGGHHGGHHRRYWGHHGGHGSAWGYAPRHYAPPRYHHNYYDRGWGRMGYHDDGALIHFLVDYARYD